MTRTLDIFCGGGGSSYGARNAGAELVCGIDVCEVATATYEENFPEATTITKALENITPRKLHDSIGDVDLLLASAECSSHTCATGSAPSVGQSRPSANPNVRVSWQF